MDRTSLYRAVAPLERDGWIKLAEGADARSRSAIVTRKGGQVLAKAAAGWNEIQDEVIGSFGPAKWKVLTGELERLSKCAEAAAKKLAKGGA